VDDGEDEEGEEEVVEDNDEDRENLDDPVWNDPKQLARMTFTAAQNRLQQVQSSRLLQDAESLELLLSKTEDSLSIVGNVTQSSATSPLVSFTSFLEAYPQASEPTVSFPTKEMSSLEDTVRRFEASLAARKKAATAKKKS
jgi:hypothetical protein